MAPQHPMRRREDRVTTWRERFAVAWRNSFYRNSTIYVMVLLTVLVVLQVTESMSGIHCGL